MFESLPPALNSGIFLVLATLIWQAGTRLSYCIDAIAERTHIARAFLGLILLATATGLPEMVTTTTAALQGKATLALNNMFGGMMLQVAVLAIADIFVKDGTLTSRPRKPTNVVAGLFLICSLAWVLVLHLVGDRLLALHVGYGSVCAAALYLFAMYTLRSIEHRDVWSVVDIPDERYGPAGRSNRYDAYPLRKLVLGTGMAAAAILVCGVLVVRVADTLAGQTGLGTSFIGASLLAFTTSMPELSTSIAAVRVKAYTMAIANIFGSNLIMTFLLLPVDAFFTGGPIINEIDRAANFALMSVILLTAIYCVGLLIRPKWNRLGMGMDSMLVLAVYLASLFTLYQLR